MPVQSTRPESEPDSDHLTVEMLMQSPGPEANRTEADPLTMEIFI